MGVYQETFGDHVGDISLEATGAPQPGPPAKSAEGRMPHVGMLANPPPAGWEDKHPAWGGAACLWTDITRSSGHVMRPQARPAGSDAVDRWIGDSDAPIFANHSRGSKLDGMRRLGSDSEKSN